MIMNDLPIGDYALLSDCRSAALVSRGGSVDWLCAPRFDSSSIFGRLLDATAGYWSIHPVGPVEVSRRYLPETMVLETTFRTSTGALRLVDAMPLGQGERGHDLGLASPGALLRQATCFEGSLELELEFAPRPEYGIVHPLLAPSDGGVIARGGADVLVLSGPVRTELGGSIARARVGLQAGQTVGFALRHGRSWEPVPATWGQDEIANRVEDTIAGWRSWSAIHQQYEVRGASWSTTAAASCRPSPSARRAPSSRRRRPACPRASAASATGITATRGSAMPA
jgi:GH15 family glucan-1,4-alpha-glucosidase